MKNRLISIFFVILLVIYSISPVFASQAEEGYYIQVGAFESKAKAVSEAEVMKLAGYDSVVIRVGSFYKVFLGPYPTIERAREIQDTLGLREGFLVLKSEMFKTTEPSENAVEETTEAVAEETTEEVAEETTEEVAEETTEEVVEEATEEVAEEATEEVAEETTEEVVEEATEEVAEEANEKSEDYKLFTIIFISVLWLIFILVVLIYRLGKNKKR